MARKRLWRGDKSTGTLHDSSVAGGSHDVSTHVIASNSRRTSPAVNQQLSKVVCPSRTSRRVLCFRNVSDALQTSFSVVQEAVGLIPVAGAGLKAAIAGLHAILKDIDQRAQNKHGLSTVNDRLNSLSRHLINAPPTRTPSEEERRRILTCQLEDGASKLSELRSRIIVGSPLLTAEIAECLSEISRYISDYMFSSQMEVHTDVKRIVTMLETGGSLPLTVTSGHVTLVDATGRQHDMLLDQCSSFDRLVAFLPGVLDQCRPNEAEVQRWYINRQQYNFAIDDGINVTQLRRQSDGWSTIQPGTKIVMRIVTTEVVRKFSARYRCRCGTRNDAKVDEATLLNALARGRIITCRRCQRRFQIAGTKGNMIRREGSQPNDDKPSQEADNLIRNFLVIRVLENEKPKRIHVFIFQAAKLLRDYLKAKRMK